MNSNTKNPNWLSEGYEHIWLPYTQMQTAPMPMPVVSAKGCTLTVEDGRELIDGIASWWSVAHGHSHPHINEAIKKQVDQFSHVMFAGLAHEAGYTLAQRLCKIAPEGLSRCFFSDSGSISVEVALKMSLQYWQQTGHSGKHKFIHFERGYHGDTFGTMGVSARSGMHEAFDSVRHKQFQLPLPNDEYSMAEFRDMVEAIAPQTAGLVMEPLVQGAGGMRFHSPDIVAEIRRICRENDILFIADEIMTGFARTGSMFACDEIGITPDILCVGKGLTGGAMSLAATLATEEIFEAFLHKDISHALMHGPTFMGNPLACAAANASLDLFEQHDRIADAERIEAQCLAELAPLKGLDGVRDVRAKGAIGVVQIDANMQEMFALRPKFIERGIWLRPFNDVVYILPPFSITQEELSRVTSAVVEIVGEWSEKR